MIGRLARQPEIDLAGERLRHQPGRGLAIDGQPDQRPPYRHTGDERPGTVDRVDDPGEAAAAGLIVPFLADDGMIGETVADQFADGELGLPVGLGDRIEADIPLVIHRDILAEAGQRHRRRDLGGVEQGAAHQVGGETAQRCIFHVSLPDAILRVVPVF